MRKLVTIAVGLVLTGLLLWLVLGGVNVWRHAAFPQPPDGGVRIRFFKKP